MVEQPIQQGCGQGGVVFEVLLSVFVVAVGGEDAGGLHVPAAGGDQDPTSFALLAIDPNAVVKVSLEIQATFPNGVQDQTKRAVSENAKTLGFNLQEWE